MIVKRVVARATEALILREFLFFRSGCFLNALPLTQ
jgi:hypothetical protein